MDVLEICRYRIFWRRIWPWALWEPFHWGLRTCPQIHWSWDSPSRLLRKTLRSGCGMGFPTVKHLEECHFTAIYTIRWELHDLLFLHPVVILTFELQRNNLVKVSSADHRVQMKNADALSLLIWWSQYFLLHRSTRFLLEFYISGN